MSQHQSIEVKGAETPAGTARAEAPGPSGAREKAKAVPAESAASETEIDDFQMKDCLRFLISLRIKPLFRKFSVNLCGLIFSK